MELVEALVVVLGMVIFLFLFLVCWCASESFKKCRQKGDRHKILNYKRIVLNGELKLCCST